MPTPLAPDAEIAQTLAAFLRRPHLNHVFLAEQGATTPQPLAYFVHFPRLYVAIGGRDAMWMEQAGEARLVRLAKGDSVIVPANSWNRPLPDQSCHALNVLFGRRQIGLSLVRHAPRGKTSAAKATLHGPMEDAPRAIMHALLTMPAGSTDVARPLVEALLRSIHHALTATPTKPQRRAANLYESVCMYVQEHFQSPLSRDSVAAHFRVTPTHVSRLFKREGMVSFNHYVTYVRMNRAKYLLRQHRQTIDEIATLCGFTETSYFCRVFKQKTELTPSAYRQMQRATGGTT